MKVFITGYFWDIHTVKEKKLGIWVHIPDSIYENRLDDMLGYQRDVKTLTLEEAAKWFGAKSPDIMMEDFVYQGSAEHISVIGTPEEE